MLWLAPRAVRNFKQVLYRSANMSVDEARALFLETYVLLGQLVQAAPPPATLNERAGGNLDATAPLGMPPSSTTGD